MAIYADKYVNGIPIKEFLGLILLVQMEINYHKIGMGDNWGQVMSRSLKEWVLS